MERHLYIIRQFLIYCCMQSFAAKFYFLDAAFELLIAACCCSSVTVALSAC